MDPATLIGIDRIAGVRMADGTFDDSWCQVGYLSSSDPEPTKQTKTPHRPSSEIR